jgi:hypothetical protein
MTSQNIFIKAIRDNDFDHIKANISICDRTYEHNYVIESVKYNRLEILKYFYKNGFEVTGIEYIYKATKYDNVNIIDYLHKLGRDLSTIIGGIMLNIALSHNNYKTVVYLLRKGVCHKFLNNDKNCIESVTYLNECITTMIRNDIEVHKDAFRDMRRNQGLRDLYELQKYTFKTRKVFHKKLVDQRPVSYDIIISFI